MTSTADRVRLIWEFLGETGLKGPLIAATVLRHKGFLHGVLLSTLNGRPTGLLGAFIEINIRRLHRR